MAWHSLFIPADYQNIGFQLPYHPYLSHMANLQLYLCNHPAMEHRFYVYLLLLMCFKELYHEPDIALSFYVRKTTENHFNSDGRLCAVTLGFESWRVISRCRNLSCYDNWLKCLLRVEGPRKYQFKCSSRCQSEKLFGVRFPSKFSVSSYCITVWLQ